MQDQHCQTCRYWKRSEDEAEGLGECRRHAPTVAPHWERDHLGRAIGRWALTYEDDGCGDFAPLPVKQRVEVNGP